MKLDKLITVKTGYTRSVNVERDATGLSLIEQYIPTSRALRTIKRVSDALHHDTAQRAWSLVGPYGSGKSAFALFATHLFGVANSKQTRTAYAVLKASDAKLARALARADTHYLKVLISGSPEPLTRKLLVAILNSTEVFYRDQRGKKPAVIKRIAATLKKDDIAVSEFLEILETLSAALEKKGLNGIILVIDELGKFLEYEARHYGANDIFLLQALAERTAKGGSFNLVMFVLLHQSFEQYAKGLGEGLKNEWGKIQGRFEEVPFLEPEEQTLRVVSAAFDHNLTAEKRRTLKQLVNRPCQDLVDLDALPGVIKAKDAKSLFTECYPLHPITAMLLPGLCQKIAQNERTLFSYLGSQEENGLTRKLSELEFGEFLNPSDVYDYFVTNQSSFMGDYATHRRWVEVQTAIERLGDASEELTRLLKTIGLFNIMGSKGEFKPSKELLSSIFTNKSRLNRALKLLQEKSVINYRKFSREYRVWQGSDFDLEGELQAELNNLGNFALAEELNQSDQLIPIVARKYSIDTGALRYFVPIFVDARSYLKLPRENTHPRVIFYLAFGEDDKRLMKPLTDYFSKLDIIVRCSTSEKLRNAVAEVICLRRIQSTSPALSSDPVARREFEDRLFSASATERLLIQSFLEEPELHEWRYQGKKLTVVSKKDLQSQLSNVLESIYTKTPIVHNELINRDRPSTQANAARNKLLYAMQESAHLPDLGIDKFPAEKAIYRALLKETGIHQYPDEPDQPCFFGAPGKNGSQIVHVWRRIDEFLASTENEARSFVELSVALMAPPFGVKAGLLPVLYFASYLVNQSELALYENRRYRPAFSEDMIERFTKRPDEFTVQRFRISGLRGSIFAQYSKVIHGDTEQRTLLELAKPLAGFMGALPEYTQKTRRGLSDRAQKVRTAFNLSKSPERLLFEELPAALGYGDLENASQADLEDFSEHLIEVLRELRDAHVKMTGKQKGLLAQVLNREPEISLKELRQVAKQLYGLESYSADTKGLNAFLSRLSKVEANDDAWFENLLMFLGHKPSQKWLDSDQDSAEYRLNDFANRILELEKIRLQLKEQGDSASDVEFMLLKTVKKGEGTKDEVILIDDALAKRIAPIITQLQDELEKLGSKEAQLAAIASIADRYLSAMVKTKATDTDLKVIDGGRSNE